ncbi:CIA30 family protein [Maribacter sp.]|nr:CIA30 family protein [Maribacter sp.]
MTGTFLFDFNSNSDASAWRVVDDGVMGGLSQGQFAINEAGHGFFRGEISLDNNGGFSSVRHTFEPRDVSNFSGIFIRLKGDGKAYQFRVKEETGQRFSHIADIKTNGEWETIRIEFSEMYPAFRGRLLDLPNYTGKNMTEIAFLIGNKEVETFALEIDFIELR